MDPALVLRVSPLATSNCSHCGAYCKLVSSPSRAHGIRLRYLLRCRCLSLYRRRTPQVSTQLRSISHRRLPRIWWIIILLVFYRRCPSVRRYVRMVRWRLLPVLRRVRYPRAPSRTQQGVLAVSGSPPGPPRAVALPSDGQAAVASAAPGPAPPHQHRLCKATAAAEEVGDLCVAVNAPLDVRRKSVQGP